jgi:1-acyl-sn-glycerol-3-phosphate acyltransferase
MHISKNFTGKLHATVALAVLMLTTALGSIPILFLGLAKLIPNQRLKIFCTKMVDKIATVWTDINNVYLDKSNPAHLQITGTNDFNPNGWYLVVANHQSWLDIVILQRLFNRKIPVLKFFIKDQLKWVPFLGFSWWAMGCPFMKRYSPAYLAKHPHKKGKDIQATQKALTSFKETPASLMSFIEGTRYTPQKKITQNSPYQHLLKPKAGGIGFVISAMNKQINQLIDVTIIYPKHDVSLWDFLCHRIDSIKINVRQLPIPDQFLSPSLLEDDKVQTEFRQWLNQKWFEKDNLISEMKTGL